MKKQIAQIKQLIAISKKIVVISHVNPDGDAIGSMLAFYHYLLSLKKSVSMISPNYLQEFLKWMDEKEDINIFVKNWGRAKRLIGEADLIIILDLNQTNRLGEAANDIINSKAKKILIDHHVQITSFTDITICDEGRCATAELVFDIIKELNGGIPFDNPIFNESIYVGIVTDTGNFDFGSYNGHTLNIVAQLIENGVDKEKVRLNVFNNYSLQRMRLMGYALDKKMVILEKYATGYIFLTKKELDSYNYVKGDTEGFANLPLQIKDITFAVLIVEKIDMIKFSFRSQGNFPVNIIANRFFSGGGHENAAGGEFVGSIDEAIALLEKILPNNNPLVGIDMNL